jgi:hypothetical protein
MPNVEAEVTVEVTVSVEGHERDSVVFGTATVLPTEYRPTPHITDSNDVRVQKAVMAALNEVFKEEVARLLNQTAAQAHSNL